MSILSTNEPTVKGFRPAWIYDNGGRDEAGFRGVTGDCVTRAIAIATGMSYRESYGLVNQYGAAERITKRRTKKGSARTGIRRPTTRRLMAGLGWLWTPTMFIGSGCRVHLRGDELPSGRLVVAVSKHVCAVIDGVIHDTYDPTRDGTRCVYGYWRAA